MKYRNILLTLLFLMSLGVAYADMSVLPGSVNLADEMASNVLTIKMPVIDSKRLENNSTDVYMGIVNSGQLSHQLIGVYTPIADQARLLQVSHVKGRTKTEQIANVEIPVHAETDLTPKGIYIRLIGIKQTLVPDSVISVTLLFSDGSWMQANAKVS